MRDTKRIKKFCDELAEIWESQCPDWRFGQLVVNVVGSMPRDPFFVEEEEMMDYIKKYFNVEDE